MNNYRPDGMLPITPSPKQFEPLLGYVLRVSELNGYRTPWHVFHLAGIREGQMVRSTLKPNSLAAILGKPPELLTQLPWDCWPNGERLPKIGAGSAVIRTLIDLRHPKICPDCIKEHGVIEAAWDLKVMIACPVHRCLLVDHCQACGERLTWFRRGISQCRCGAEIAATVSAISIAASELLALVRCTLYGTSFEARTKADLPARELCDLGPLGLLTLIRCLRFWLVRPDRGSTHESFTHSQLETVAGFFVNWPNGVHNALAASLNKRNDAPQSAKKRIERLVILLNEVPVPPIQLKFVHHAVATFGTLQWNGIVTDHRTRRRVGISYDQLRIGSISDLGRRMGVDRRTAKKMTEAGFVPSRTIHLPHSTRKVVDLPADLPVKVPDGAIGERDASKCIGLSVSVLQELRVREIYKTKHLGRVVKQFHHLDLSAMRSGFLELAECRLTSVSPGNTSVASLMQRKFKVSGAKSAVLAAIWNGELKPIGRLGDAIGDLVVPHEQALAIAEDLRSAAADSLPVSKAAAAIGCDPAVFQALGQLGHLKIKRTGYEILVDTKSLWEFARHFVPIAVLAKDRNQSSKNLTKKLADTGAVLLAVPRNTGALSTQVFLRIAGDDIEPTPHAVAIARSQARITLDRVLP